MVTATNPSLALLSPQVECQRACANMRDRQEKEEEEEVVVVEEEAVFISVVNTNEDPPNAH